MTPEEKGEALMLRFRDDKWTSQVTNAGAYRCAIVCVEEIITNNFWEDSENQANYRHYWQQVLNYLKEK